MKCEILKFKKLKTGKGNSYNLTVSLVDGEPVEVAGGGGSWCYATGEDCGTLLAIDLDEAVAGWEASHPLRVAKAASPSTNGKPRRRK